MNRLPILALILSAVAMILALLSGCTADGRFDTAAFDQVTRTTLDAYDRYDRYHRPAGAPVNPPGAPFPIYPPAP